MVKCFDTNVVHAYVYTHSYTILIYLCGHIGRQVSFNDCSHAGVHHVWIHAWVCSRIHMCTHVVTCIHTSIYTCMHVHVHVLTRINVYEIVWRESPSKRRIFGWGDYIVRWREDIIYFTADVNAHGHKIRFWSSNRDANLFRENGSSFLGHTWAPCVFHTRVWSSVCWHAYPQQRPLILHTYWITVQTSFHSYGCVRILVHTLIHLSTDSWIRLLAYACTHVYVSESLL